MINKVARFEHVIKEQIEKDIKNCNLHAYGLKAEDYEKMELPKRATTGSAGYDFYTPMDITLHPGQTIKFPTGIRCYILDGWMLSLFPRSGLGFKYRLQLDNTVGIIDSDYYFSDNEGHIHAKLTNDSKDGKVVVIPKGTAYMQGIFIPYGVTVDDNTNGVRNGGFGSTTEVIEPVAWSDGNN